MIATPPQLVFIVTSESVYFVVILIKSFDFTVILEIKIVINNYSPY